MSVRTDTNILLRLVATMNVHGIRRILTFNTGDLARYDIQAVHPRSLLA
jgi:hypothetical protein